MTEDKAHNFYIGTPVGLFHYDRKTKSFTRLTYTFPGKNEQAKFGFDALYYDHKGFLYAGSGSYGLFIYNEHSKQLSHYNLDPARPDSWENRRLNTVSSFAAHAADNTKLWVGTFHGIYLFDKIKKTFTQNFEVINPAHYLIKPDSSAIPEHYDIQQMDIPDDSTIWFNCWTAGFGKYNTRTGKVKMFLHGARLKTPNRYIGYIIHRFAKLYPGKYLIGIYDYKIALFDCQTEEVQYFSVTNNDYTEEQTSFATNDRQGNIWLLQRGLLYTVIPDHIQLQTVKVLHFNKIDFPRLHGIYFDRATNYYYGAFYHDAGVNVFDTNFNLIKTIPVPLINNIYTYNSGLALRISKDGNDRFWTAGPENYVLTKGAQKFEPVEKIFPSLSWMKTKAEFTDVVTTNNGDILYKNSDGVVYHIRHQTLEVDTINPPAIKAGAMEIKPSSSWYDAKRNFIYLVSRTGIARHNLATGQTSIVYNSSLFGNLTFSTGVCSPALDGGGNIWLMIPQYGIRIINPETLYCEDSIPYGTRGLMRGYYTTITGAEKPFMLLRSHNGIVVYDYVKQQSYLFDQDNGLSSPDNISLLYCNGQMLIGQTGSFEHFKLSGLKNYSPELQFRLNSIVSDTSLVYLNSGNTSATTIRLPHYQNSLSLSFSAKEFIFPERIEYAYQLSGIDNDWKYTNYFNRKINYTKLSPGKYVFRIKAQLEGGNWRVVPVEYTIIIIPAWWQTTLFKVVCIFFAALVVFYLIRLRIQAVRKRERLKANHEKELLELEAKALRAQMNPHFIFNFMNSIKSLIQHHEEEKSVRYLTTFSKLICTLFNNANKKEISLYDEIETCKLYLQLEAMRFDTKFSYAVKVEENLDLKSVQVPALIIQPFIENAIWHGIVPKREGGHVELAVTKKDNAVEISINDNGIGRESSK